MRNKPRKQSDKSTDIKYELKNVTNTSELPQLYVGFPDDVKYASERMNQIESKLLIRGFKVPRPLHIFRFTTTENNIPIGKKTMTVKRAKPSVMVCVEITKDGD